jgi:hypothetical protein
LFDAPESEGTPFHFAQVCFNAERLWFSILDVAVEILFQKRRTAEMTWGETEYTQV